MAKVLSEKETRKNLLILAKRLGCHKEVVMIFDKYDKALHLCKNEGERKHMAACGAAELHKFLYCKGSLVVDGVELIPAEKENNDLIKL